MLELARTKRPVKLRPKTIETHTLSFNDSQIIDQRIEYLRSGYLLSLTEKKIQVKVDHCALE